MDREKALSMVIEMRRAMEDYARRSRTHEESTERIRKAMKSLQDYLGVDRSEDNLTTEAASKYLGKHADITVVDEVATHDKRTETHECVRETHGDLISRADAVSREDVIGYIDRVSNSGMGKNKSLEYIRKYVERTESAATDMSGYSARLWKAAYERGKAEGCMSEDCISRKQAIKAMVNGIWNLPDECYPSLNDYGVVLDLVMDSLASLPSVKPIDKDKRIKELEALFADMLASAQSAPMSTPTAEDMGEVSDGYHTFNQLYHQRAVLFATIVNQNKNKAWKSWKHEDGKFCFDKGGEWFIVGVDTPEGSYTYHYEKKYWDLFDCEELDRGKHWDGHTEEDVTRLLSLPTVTHDKRTDLISRQEALEEITDMVNNAQQKGGKFDLAVSYGLLGARAVIKDLPSAEPVHGEWIPARAVTIDGVDYVEYAKCSNCGEVALFSMNYCPNCGSQMIYGASIKIGGEEE